MTPTAPGPWTHSRTDDRASRAPLCALVVHRRHEREYEAITHGRVEFPRDRHTCRLDPGDRVHRRAPGPPLELPQPIAATSKAVNNPTSPSLAEIRSTLSDTGPRHAMSKRSSRSSPTSTTSASRRSASSPTTPLSRRPGLEATAMFRSRSATPTTTSFCSARTATRSLTR